jgi:Flp pilus assembly pilin Flp
VPDLGPRGRLRRQDGQATVEYAFLIALIAIAVVAAMLFLAGSLQDLFEETGEATAEFRPPIVHCDASYAGVCIPPAPPDLDCTDLSAMGVALPVQVVGSDPHGLDQDGDGLGC